MPSTTVAIARKTTITLLQSATLPQPVSPSAIHGPATGIRRSFAPTVSGQANEAPRARPYQAAVDTPPAMIRFVRVEGGGRLSTRGPGADSLATARSAPGVGS